MVSNVQKNRNLKVQLRKAFEVKVKQASKKFVTDVVLSTWRFIIVNSEDVSFAYGSPVRSGQYYTNHRISLNYKDTSVDLLTKNEFVEGDPPRPPLPIKIARDVMASWKSGDKIFISNSLDYYPKIEEGFSSKAPEGVYRVAAELVKVKFKDYNLAVSGGFNG